MRKYLKELYKDAGWYLITFIVFYWWFVLLSSCNPAKKITRQDSEAVQRVTAKRPLLDIVGAKWRDLNPCVSDTNYQYIKGDSIILYNNDTLYLQGINDTVFRNITKTVTKTIHDTLIRTVIDRNALDSANAIARRFELSNKEKDVDIATITMQKKEQQGKANKWFLWFIGMSCVAGLTGFLFIKKQFFI